MRAWLPLLFLTTVATATSVLAACGGEADPHYGPPDGLRGATFPTATATTPPGDAGNPPPGDGGTQQETGTAACKVQWSTQIYPLMKTTGPWKCAASGCHAAGAAQPVISDTDPVLTYTNLKAYTQIGAHPYVNPASTDPAQSSFECNLLPTTPNGCGAEQMPKADATLNPTKATTDQVTLVDTWVKCGAPQN